MRQISRGCRQGLNDEGDGDPQPDPEGIKQQVSDVGCAEASEVESLFAHADGGPGGDAGGNSHPQRLIGAGTRGPDNVDHSGCGTGMQQLVDLGLRCGGPGRQATQQPRTQGQPPRCHQTPSAPPCGGPFSLAQRSQRRRSRLPLRICYSRRVSYVLACPTLVYEVIPDHFATGARPLRAIIDKLPHLASLGVDGLALTPLLPGHDPLRLHTTSFEGIDPALGTEDDLAALCEAAQGFGIQVVAMGVFDHVSDAHPWFVAAKEQTDDDRRVPPEQRTRAFFHFSPELRHGYACRDGSAREPELDLADPEVRRRLFAAEDSIIHRLIERGVAGWRILRAEQVGYSILRELQRAVRTVEGSHFVVGDIKGFADRYQRDGLLDAVVNHYAREAVLAFLKGEIPARQLARVERDLVAAYGKSLARAWMPLSDHDTPRLPGLLPDGARVRLATLLAYTLPGCAHVLYGEEVGLAQNHALPAATPMVWDESVWDQPTLALHRRLGAVRQARAALRTGDFVDLTPEGEYEVFAFARVTTDPRETVIVVVNRAERPLTRKLFAPMSDLPDGMTLRDILLGEGGGRRVRVRSGSLHLEVEPAGAVLLVPDDEDEDMRRFFRGY